MPPKRPPRPAAPSEATSGSAKVLTLRKLDLSSFRERWVLPLELVTIALHTQAAGAVARHDALHL